MKVLVACEESQVVTTELRNKGIEAYSCDIMETSGTRKEWHIQKDVREILEEKWDAIIAFPPCTYLCNASAPVLFGNGFDRERYEKGLKAKEFFMLFYNHKCKKIAIENPIPLKIFNLPSYSQIIHPYNFGHGYTKKTCLWLKGFPPLFSTNIVRGEIKSWVYSGERTSRRRSKTFSGVAKAMAEQWF